MFFPYTVPWPEYGKGFSYTVPWRSVYELVGMRRGSREVLLDFSWRDNALC
jgi:hypothetical protein